MNEEEFINNATKLLTEDLSIPKEDAENLAKLAIILNNNNL